MKRFIFLETEFLSEAQENQSQHKRFIDATVVTYKGV